MTLALLFETLIKIISFKIPSDDDVALNIISKQKETINILYSIYISLHLFMSSRSLIDLPTVVIHSIFNWLGDDEDKVFLYLTCKRLHHYKYLTLEHYSDRDQCAHGPIERYKKVTISGVGLSILAPKHKLLYHRLKERGERSLVTSLVLYFCSSSQCNVLEITPSITCLSIEGETPRNLLDSKNLSNLVTLKIAKSHIKDIEQPDYTRHLGIRGDTFPKLTRLEVPYIYIDNTNCKSMNQLPSSLTSFKTEIGTLDHSGDSTVLDFLTNLPNLQHLCLEALNRTTPLTRFPSNLVSLDIAELYNQRLEPGMLPPTLTNLCIKGYQQKIPDDTFPIGLQSLEIKESNLACLTNLKLPPMLTSLSIHDSSIGIVIPDTVKFLTFRCDGQQNLGTLPSSLEYLELLGLFSPAIKLPQGVRVVKLNVSGLHLARGFLPSTVCQVEFGDDVYFQSTFEKDWAPDSVETIKFGSRFDRAIRFPPHLKHVEFGQLFKGSSFIDEFQQKVSLEYALPPTIESVRFGACFYYHNLINRVLPSSIKRLYFTNLAHVQTALPNDFTFPPTLEVLQFPILDYQYEIPQLPDTLLKLYIVSTNKKHQKCIGCHRAVITLKCPIPIRNKLVRLPNYPQSMIIYNNERIWTWNDFGTLEKNHP
ncbi:hypothetical protein DFA_06048 [Cavenderia fasciculata]|uniref:Uncharacterized protein n=1 Tax=Cavenderia fasciculata TaxID=261658 RepID=F4PJY6_CACFS|nr:uncharacterized protein DFA_06048 [Cavenderia fasciculata]EGG23910.1 hypothetical protein DFA_06048 [Cavenderia fasciculata]|eukprot:XP_004361761.1 hypothetical protein DFA_06048 [Cavenderia fasciculata]